MPAEKLIWLCCYVTSMVFIAVLLNELEFLDDGSIPEIVQGFMHLVAGFGVTGMAWIFGGIFINAVTSLF